MFLFHFLRYFILLASESNFPQCTVLYWRLCGLTKSPLLNTLSTEAEVHGAQKVISNNGFRMANCCCCLSQNAMVYLAHCRQELQQKSWKTARPRPRPRTNVQDQDQDFMIQDQDQDFHCCPLVAPRPRPWSRGLHHWFCGPDTVRFRHLCLCQIWSRYLYLFKSYKLYHWQNYITFLQGFLVTVSAWNCAHWASLILYGFS